MVRKTTETTTRGHLRRTIISNSSNRLRCNNNNNSHRRSILVRARIITGDHLRRRCIISRPNAAERTNNRLRKHLSTDSRKLLLLSSRINRIASVVTDQAITTTRRFNRHRSRNKRRQLCSHRRQHARQLRAQRLPRKLHRHPS